MTDPSPPLTVDQLAEAIARLFHVRFDRLAPAFGWTPQESARGKDFDALPESNRKLMIATVRSLLESGVIEPGPAVLDTFRKVPDAG